MSIITTFESQCRALAKAPSQDDNASRFLVGTQSPTRDNFVYLFEYKDDNNNLAKIPFKFPHGEVWHLSTSNRHPNHFEAVTCENGRFGVALYKLPLELNDPIEDDFGLSDLPIEKVFDLAINEKNLTKVCHWHPDDGEQLLLCKDGVLEFWDSQQQQRVQDFPVYEALEKSDNSHSDKKSPQVTDIRWSSLFNCSVIATAIGSRIYGIDTRIPHTSPSSVCWLIEDSRCNRVGSIDFNPNSQYYLASGGDDCRANFWDLRKTSSPSLHFQVHTHWIWSIRYNPFHDQLVLSSGSDARIALMRAQSIASEPFGQMVDYEDGEVVEESIERDSQDNETVDEVKLNVDTDVTNDKESEPTSDTKTTKTKQLGDEVINVYSEHDDSVYAVEWASDPWIFASLGYESRLVINRVPKAEKFNILF